MSLDPYYVGLPAKAQQYIRDNNLHMTMTFRGDVGGNGEEYEFAVYLEKGKNGDTVYPYPDTDSVWFEEVQNISSENGGENRIFTKLSCLVGKRKGEKIEWSNQDKLFNPLKPNIPEVGNVPRG
jgi:hypothetical protein